MSELMNKQTDRNFRWQLMTTVSAFALISSAYVVARADASDEDQPTVWIELGGQLEQISGGEEAFVPPVLVKTPRPSVETISPVGLEHPPRFSNGGEAKVSFSPHDSDWLFSISARYGRSSGAKHVHQQSYPPSFTAYLGGSKLGVGKPIAAQFTDTTVEQDESHAILDFNAGKDIGLGLFGIRGTSTLNLGVRVAQFRSKSSISFKSDPDFHFSFKYGSVPGQTKFPKGEPYHSNAGHLTATRSFQGIGPSLSWNASMPVVGHPDTSEIALDWGANAAVLFGRQKASVQRGVVAHYHGPKYPDYGPARYVVLYDHETPIPDRRRSVIVPNIGGFAGLSFHYSAAKVSLGYRADFFFGAMDGGIETAKSENRGFYGPFASISVGLGG